ncbi:ABC transporter permease [Bifidobacterium platyrrhinorum]|uniref:ABC transporter permease n=1 Tax=Bifidobacterium platyrrhinorum TaxID=2661628 RepID=A0A6L9SW57_9BIFI|nr:ABC transporter permease [Bifidobacterium platyrrhinorum]NEG55762.1 ABC transporter permease [Bifidobacterium platyrrhinorum]
MNTCKATLRVLAAHKLYIIIYLVLIGIMMLAISGSALFGDRNAAADVYEPGRATVAVIDRDSDRGGVASSLRAYLAADDDVVDLADEPQALQQAVASNWVDLIVIIPDGYADKLLDSATSSGADGSSGKVPAVETVTSYTSGAGSMASMAIGGFLSLTRTELIGTNVTGTTDAADPTGTTDQTGMTGTVTRPELDDLTTATTRVRALARDRNANHAIAVDHTDAEAAADADAASAGERTAAGFGSTIKSALYPLFLAMTVCTALVSGVFNAGETRRRLFASPQRSSTMGMQRMATLCGFALVVVAVYLLAAVALMLAAGLDPMSLAPAGVAMTILSACVYALMTVACGFLLGEAGVGDTMANGFANVFGLLLLFTSGLSLPVDMLPESMLAVGRMLPGWWYCTAIDDALGIGTASSGGVDAAGWATGTGIVALFAVAFVALGLAVGRIRRSRPAPVSAAVTQLAEA